MLRIFKVLFVLLVIFTGLAVHLRNDQTVTFDYYLGTLDLPFSICLLIAVSLGILFGILATVPIILRLGREKSRLSSRNRLNEKELETLRIIPLRD